MSTVPPAALALIQPLPSVKSASTLVRRANFGFLGSCTALVGGDDEGVALGVLAGQTRLDHGEIVFDMANLLIAQIQARRLARRDEIGHHSGNHCKGRRRQGAFHILTNWV